MHVSLSNDDDLHTACMQHETNNIYVISCLDEPKASRYLRSMKKPESDMQASYQLAYHIKKICAFSYHRAQREWAHRWHAYVHCILMSGPAACMHATLHLSVHMLVGNNLSAPSVMHPLTEIINKYSAPSRPLFFRGTASAGSMVHVYVVFGVLAGVRKNCCIRIVVVPPPWSPS